MRKMSLTILIALAAGTASAEWRTVWWNGTNMSTRANYGTNAYVFATPPTNGASIATNPAADGLWYAWSNGVPTAFTPGGGTGDLTKAVADTLYSTNGFCGFVAYNAGNQPGTSLVLSYLSNDTVVVDGAGGYATTTGTYTVPAALAGYWSFVLRGNWDDLDGAETSYVGLEVIRGATTNNYISDARPNGVGNDLQARSTLVVTLPFLCTNNTTFRMYGYGGAADAGNVWVGTMAHQIFSGQFLGP